MYEAFYGLSADPFRLNPDPRFYFKSPGHQKAMAYLTYGLEKAEGFVVITGDTGTGKTTLAQRLLKDLDDQSHITATLTNTQLDPLEALQSIAQEFGLSNGLDTKPKIIENLRRFFELHDKASERALLIVDEAQNLPAQTLEELRMLTNLQADGRPLIQIIFLAQPHFTDMIDRPGFAQFRERVGAAVDLDRLRRSDIKGYVEHRLSVAGWTGDPQITDAAFDLIFETTGGLPRRINKFLARSLLAAFLDERHEIDTPLVAQVKAELREDPSWKEDILPATALDDGPSAPPLNKGLESRISELESEVKSIEKMLRQLLDLLVKRQHGN